MTVLIYSDNLDAQISYYDRIDNLDRELEIYLSRENITVTKITPSSTGRYEVNHYINLDTRYHFHKPKSTAKFFNGSQVTVFEKEIFNMANIKKYF